MKIEHIAIWTRDLEKMREFYQTYFQMKSEQRYENPNKGFSSYFLSFDTGARIELMTKTYMPDNDKSKQELSGLTHFAISVGDKMKVNALTEQLRKDGYEVAGEPRTTGDGYYESVILDPEGNRIEITE
jgi:lactoylglutathione lyase